MEIPASVLMNLEVKCESPEEIERRKTKTKQEAQKRKFKSWLARDPEKYNRVMGQLSSNFPLLFNVYHPPMKKGIFQDIRSQIEVPSRDLRYTLNRYCSSFRYLNSLVSGGSRLDLLGNSIEDVTEEEQDVAKSTLKAELKAYHSKHKRNM